jgi:hypothetical protein
MSAAVDQRTMPQTLVAGRYEVVARLAQGGMGEVFHVRETATGRDMALKRLLHSASRASALFQAEYHALARLRHPFIVAVYDYGLDEGRPYYTMELLGGADLRECGITSVPDACLHLRDVATSLALLHAQRLVHRDISPRNVRKTETGRCKLFDFGTMVPYGIPPNVAGTSPFISPEALDGAMLDQRADLYSLGALGYWLLSGELHAAPRALDHRVADRSVPTRLTRVRPEVPAALDDLIMALLEPDPGRRPWSAHEVIARLNSIGDLPGDDSAALARSHLGSSRMVGRRREMDSALRAMKRSQQYEGGSLLVDGAPGVGKSRFLQELCWLGQTHGFCVVRGYGAQADAGMGLISQLHSQIVRSVPEAEKRLSESEREILQRFLSETRPERPEDLRAEVQWAMTALVRAATRESPILLVIDDVDHADGFSAAFVTALAHVATTRPLLLVTSVTPALGREPPAWLASFSKLARPLKLLALSSHETRALIGDVLGRPTHYARFADWVYHEAHGNAAATLQLTSWLVERGVIAFVNGGFVLPEGAIHASIPDEHTRPLALRLLQLPKSAFTLLEHLSLCRKGASLELCLSATGLPSAEALNAVEELVRGGVLIGAGRAYLFAQSSVGHAVRESIGKERLPAMHGALARALLATEDAGSLVLLEAGYHLLHTEREIEGAELLTKVCPGLIEAGIDCAPALNALEQAIAVLERYPNTLTMRLRGMATLARASYLHDYRLALKHSARTVEALTRWNGMYYLRHAVPYLGGLLCIALSFLFATLRRVLRPAVDRGPGAYESLQLCARAFMSYLGVRAVAIDPEGCEEIMSYFAAFRAVPPPSSARCVYFASRALASNALGREGEVARAANHALGMLSKNRLLDMSAAEQRDIRVGLMLSRAIIETHRLGTRSLHLADELEAENAPIAKAAALRVRYAYYLSRGMHDKAEPFRRKLELLAIQGGTTWQVEWWGAALTGINSIGYDDPVGASEAAERLERLSSEVPSLKPPLAVVRMGLAYLAGDYASAIAQGERWTRAYPPHALIAWGRAYVIYAQALNRVGRFADAKHICTLSLEALSPGDSESEVMYGGLRRELAFAHAGLGEVARAEELLSAREALLHKHEEHASLANAYAARVTFASMIGDHMMLARALVSMREAADASGSKSVIHRAARVAREAGKATEQLLSVAIANADHSSQVSQTADPSHSADADRAQTPPKGLTRSKRRSLLRRIVEHTGASGGLVFARPDGAGPPRLLASAGEDLPVEAAKAHATAQWDALCATSPMSQKLPIEGNHCHFVVVPIVPDGASAPVALLFLVNSGASELDFPPSTWLSELAHRTQTSTTEDFERPSHMPAEPSKTEDEGSE